MSRSDATRRPDDPLSAVRSVRGARFSWRSSTRHDAHETVVSVAGELDILTIPRLATTLDDIVRRRHGDVVIDLTRTEFIDSLGLHALLNVQRRLAERARRLSRDLPTGRSVTRSSWPG